jgi:hypothetical protein
VLRKGKLLETREILHGIEVFLGARGIPFSNSSLSLEQALGYQNQGVFGIISQNHQKYVIFTKPFWGMAPREGSNFCYANHIIC